jgi:predicted Zn-dependent protease|tara:strand:+ start:267 stop:992 length:726 start_codon:yes stop_codon:yes gene_type:complete
MTQFRIRKISEGRKPSKIKPVFVMNQEGLSDLEKRAVLDGASELIGTAEVSGVDLVDFGTFRNNGYRSSDGSLKEFQSVDWYVQRGRETSRNGRQLNADTMQFALCLEPWRDPQKGGKDHYDLFVVHDDMYSGDTNFVIGLAQPGIGTTVSTHRFKQLNDRAKYECIKTETMHELGHVFGLIPPERTQDVEYSLGKHCTNTCTMRQGLRLPDDWVNITNDRLRYGALCPTCETDLKQYFKK